MGKGGTLKSTISRRIIPADATPSVHGHFLEKRIPRMARPETTMEQNQSKSPVEGTLIPPPASACSLMPNIILRSIMKCAGCQIK